MTAHYVNSKGKDVSIADMAFPHLVSAHAKLIDAMAAEIAARETPEEAA